MGDLTAKSESQGAAALITGWMSGIALISMSHSASFLFAAYAALAPLHVIATYNLLKSADFEVLNESKTQLIIRSYLDTQEIPSPPALKKDEVFFGEFVKNSSSLPKIELGSTIEGAFENSVDFLKAVQAVAVSSRLNSYTFPYVFHRPKTMSLDSSTARLASSCTVTQKVF